MNVAFCNSSLPSEFCVVYSRCPTYTGCTSTRHHLVNIFIHVNKVAFNLFRELKLLPWDILEIGPIFHISHTKDNFERIIRIVDIYAYPNLFHCSISDSIL